MTKNRSMKIAVLVLALALLTSCFVGSTFAKYTSSATGTANAVVANWAFEVGTGNDIATTSTFAFDLFTTIKDDDKTSNETGTKENMIAPGTSGSFDIVLNNTSDVWADVTIDFTTSVGTLPTNLVFTVDGADVRNVTKTLKYGTNATVSVAWEWAYETDADSNPENGISGDAADLTAAGNNFTILATLTATQRDNQGA